MVKYFVSIVENVALEIVFGLMGFKTYRQNYLNADDRSIK